MVEATEILEVPDQEPPSELLKRVQLAPSIVQRLIQYNQQRVSIEQRINEVGLVALEAMGETGEVLSFDLQAGVAIVRPIVTALPNRAARRRATQAKKAKKAKKAT